MFVVAVLRMKRLLWCAFVVKSFAVTPCIEAARKLLAPQPSGASMSRTPSAMWGTNVGHLQGSTPPPSLLGASLTPCKLDAMSANVGLFIVNLHPLAPSRPQKQFKCGEMWGTLSTACPLIPIAVAPDAPEKRGDVTNWHHFWLNYTKYRMIRRTH